MKTSSRYVLAIVSGSVVAFLTVAIVESIGHGIYPAPAGLDYSNMARVREYVQGLPIGAMFFVLGSWVLATLTGGIVACSIARRRRLVFAGTIGGLILAASIINLVLLPHPVWFTITAVTAIPVTAFLTSRLGSDSARYDISR